MTAALERGTDTSIMPLLAPGALYYSSYSLRKYTSVRPTTEEIKDAREMVVRLGEAYYS